MNHQLAIGAALDLTRHIDGPFSSIHIRDLDISRLAAGII